MSVAPFVGPLACLLVHLDGVNLVSPGQVLWITEIRGDLGRSEKRIVLVGSRLAIGRYSWRA